MAQLRALPGIGEWTAQHIAMRELREPDAFPAGDIGLLRALTDSEGKRPTSGELLAMAERWRPWRATRRNTLGIRHERASHELTTRALERDHGHRVPL